MTRVECLGKAVVGPVVLLAAVLASACASSPDQYGMLDSTESPCAAQYRERRDQPPPPSGLSRADRDRYQGMTTDYHVSRHCQQEATRSTTVKRSWKLPPRRVE